MRHALRNIEKIKSVYPDSYVNDHIVKSLDDYFYTHSDKQIHDTIESAVPSNNINFPILRINDISDERCMLEFAVLGQVYDVIKLSFLGRMKG